MPSFVDMSKGIAFVHIPKTGGIAISSAIESNSITRCCIERYQKKYKDLESDFDVIHATANMMHNKSVKKIIAVVRNPYDRFVSMFCMGVTLGMHTFEPTKEGIMVF